MAVAYSDLPIVRATVSTATINGLITELDAAFVAAGWTSRVVISGGFVYTLTSPDPSEFKVQMTMQNAIQYLIDHPTADLYTGPSVVIQFATVGGANPGFPHQLLAHNFGAWPEMQVIAGAYQMFISVPGVTGGGWSSVAGGIPYVPPRTGACAGPSPPVITEIWWSNGGSQFPFDWRTQANCYACSTYNLNGVTTIAADNNNIRPLDGLLCLFPLTATNTYSVAQISWPTITYASNVVLNVDAFAGWQWSIRGQVWDAYLQTAAGTLDAVVAAEDIDSSGNSFTVRSITWHAEFFSSLQLIFERSGVLGNVAY